MARFVSDMNKVLGIYESGTYGTKFGGGSGVFWIGEVTSHSITHEETLTPIRYLGGTGRGVDTYEQGAKDVGGTLTYHPQDMRLVFFTIGSVFSVSGTAGVNCVHTATTLNSDSWQCPFASGTGQLNAPTSFTIEDSKQSAGTGRNFIRTLNGVVLNTTTVRGTQGGRIEVTVDYNAQGINHTSGATTSVTPMTERSYLWSDGTISMSDDEGNVSGLDTIKEVSLEIANGLTAPHYLNGSRTIGAPFVGNRELTMSLTMDLDGEDADMLYRKFYIGGSPFHMEWDLNGDVIALGSKHTEFFLSGCYITSMDNPSTIEGPIESTIEIKAGSINAIAYDTGTTSGLYHDGIQW